VTEFVTKLDLAEQLIIRSIASGEIAPGEPLRQLELADRLGVSPTPIREALRRLEAQGLVVRQPHRGVRVAEVEPSEMAELYIIRGALEGLAAEHATPNLTKRDLATLEQIHTKLEAGRAEGALKSLRKLNYDFHTRLYRRSGLPRLVRIIDSLWPLFPWDAIWAVPGRADSSAAEHGLILEALRAGDAGAAGRLMKRHIEHGGEVLVAFRREAATAAPAPRAQRGSAQKGRNLTTSSATTGKRRPSGRAPG
jgi:DNA-binding GntR family transcriptional regulator